MPTIPKTLNAIWLGSVLKDDPNNPARQGRRNIEKWKKQNPDYEMCLWIDSSLWCDKSGHVEENYQKDLKDLLEWAQRNKIVICDLALKKEQTYALSEKGNIEQIEQPSNVGAGRASPYGVITGRRDIYEGMIAHHQYYDDEINGAYRNLAAASDILRVEILYQEGGIYFDVADVFPPGEYNLCLMPDSQSSLYPRNIYLKSTENGLEYKVYDLDGALREGSIKWDALPNFPREVKDVIESKDKYLSELLNKISSVDQISLIQPLPPGGIDTTYGFLFQSGNNDFMCSIPKGSIIEECRTTIADRYRALYQPENEMLLRSHRNPAFQLSFHKSVLFRAVPDPRMGTTMSVSGPVAILDAITDLARKQTMISEAGNRPISLPLPEELALSNISARRYLSIPTFSQSGDWYSVRPDKEKLMSQIRTLVRGYFDEKIDQAIQKLGQLQISQPRFSHDLELLSQLKQRLNALPPEASMDVVYKACIADSFLEKINESTWCSNILRRLQVCGQSLDSLIDSWEQRIGEIDKTKGADESQQKMLQELAHINDFQNPHNLSNFIITVLLYNRKNGQPNLEALDSMQPSLSKLAGFIAATPTEEAERRQQRK